MKSLYMFRISRSSSYLKIKRLRDLPKALFSLDCDCFAKAGDRHREWVAKQSWNSRQRFVISSHVSPSGAK